MSAREKLITALIDAGVFSVSDTGVPSVADSNSKPSKWIARQMFAQLGPLNVRPKLEGQKAGTLFEEKVGDFLEETFPALSLVRCGDFRIGRRKKVSEFDQYEHLAEIVRLGDERREIKIAFGMDYIIQPDVVIFRHPVARVSLGSSHVIENGAAATASPLIAENDAKPTLHASVSCKLTLRSDRAQNARSEALNLVRNRKGRLPHIALVTAEPTAGRISSLALGTGDIDCVYHAALPELRGATESYLGEVKGAALNAAKKNFELLETLVDGRRLRDVADLPFDLAV